MIEEEIERFQLELESYTNKTESECLENQKHIERVKSNLDSIAEEQGIPKGYYYENHTERNLALL